MHHHFLIRYKIHHLFFWLLVCGAWYSLRYQDYAQPGTAMRVTLVKVVDLAAMVYITNYLLLPKLLYRGRWILFTLTFLLMIITSSIIKMNIIGLILGNSAAVNLSSNLKARIYDNVIPHFFLVLAGAAIRLMYDYSRLQQRLAETAKEKAEAELNFLKSQINPHFLFNSLNSVYFMIDKENVTARDSLQKFSDMLRYQLYEMNGAPIPVEKEIAYLNDYISLQRIRKNDNYEINFTYTSTVGGFMIEPLLLIAFVENAFKHLSAGSGKKHYVKVDLRGTNDELIFTAENSCDDHALPDTGSGIGLKNVQRRLELLYPGRHQLQFDRGPDKFKATLILKN